MMFLLKYIIYNINILSALEYILQVYLLDYTFSYFRIFIRILTETTKSAYFQQNSIIFVCKVIMRTDLVLRDFFC